MMSMPGQRKPIISKTSWAEKALPALTSLTLLVLVLIWRAVDAVK